MMKKVLLTMVMIGALAAAPLTSEAGSYQQRVLVTTTTVGAAMGAVMGSNRHQPLQGMLIGGMIGAATGMILAQAAPVQAQPVTVYRRVYMPQSAYVRTAHTYRHHARLHQAGYIRSYRNHEYLEHEAREHVYADED